MAGEMPTADELISAETVAGLARCLKKADPRHDWGAVGASGVALTGLGLGERVGLVRDALLADRPGSYASLASLVRAGLEDDGFSGWMIWPVSEAVAARALEAGGEGDFEDGLALLAALSPRLTSEFALRAFLNADLDRTLRTARTWTTHADAGVRRLASEGTRPRLPWAKQVPALKRHPEATAEILAALRDDESAAVRRSVANHLNDVSRIDPALAVRTASEWLDAPTARTPTLVRHAMRSLIKQGDPAALALMGFPPPQGILVVGPRLDRTDLAVGEELGFGAEVANEGKVPMRLAIDYVVHYRKANGSLAPKVFKLTTRTLGPGERTVLAGRRSFKPISTRRFHLGGHALELQVNGVRFGRAEFELT
jgi:3-methyladenine DNA glycosylase AlkC